MIANYLQTNVSVNCLQKVSMSCLQLCRWIVSKNHVDELSCRWIVSIPVEAYIRDCKENLLLNTCVRVLFPPHEKVIMMNYDEFGLYSW